MFLSIDQGTTSSRALLFDEKYNIIESFQKDFKQYYLNDGWVEHNPEEILDTVVTCCEKILKGKYSKNIQSVGITNQRETIVVWDKKTGKIFYNAIVWQDRRTAAFCKDLKNDGYEKTVSEKTGLLLDPYFSATKISWILDNVDGLRAKAQAGKVCFGTIDTWIIWKLTKGKSFATDVTNASRTSLFNIKEMEWDDELLSIFKIPLQSLPEVRSCDDYYGNTDLLFKGLDAATPNYIPSFTGAVGGPNWFKGLFKGGKLTSKGPLSIFGRDLQYFTPDFNTALKYAGESGSIVAMPRPESVRGLKNIWKSGVSRGFDPSKGIETLVKTSD